MPNGSSCVGVRVSELVVFRVRGEERVRHEHGLTSARVLSTIAVDFSLYLLDVFLFFLVFLVGQIVARITLGRARDTSRKTSGC